MYETQKVKVILLGLERDVLAIVSEVLSRSESVAHAATGRTTQDAIKQLADGAANCLFLDPTAFDSRDALGILQFCTLTFPVCLVAESKWLASFAGFPKSWQQRLRNYYRVPTDLTLPEVRIEVTAAIQGCQYYLLKRVIKANLGQIVEGAQGTPPAMVVEKAREAERALTALESGERSLLRDSLGLNAEQMRSLFDDTLSQARQTARRSEWANLVVLAAGVCLFAAMAITALVRGSADPWSFAMSGTGAAAAIAALITSPGRRITSGASRSIFVQTAFFSFLTQVRILIAPGSETSMERSQRLQEATADLLKAINVAIGPDG